MDLRPQAHEIIRTWLFSTLLRSHYEHDQVPWRHAGISGWILDPDRKKMSKSKGNVVTPMALLEELGSDAVRYWAASARPGTDTAFDTGQMKVGRRLAVKLLNASKFVLTVGPRVGPDTRNVSTTDGTAVLGFAAGDKPAEFSEVTVPLDRAMLAELASVVDAATEAFEGYDYSRALERAEQFFWFFCDNYMELVKTRAYGEQPGETETQAQRDRGVTSARAALRLALDTQLRLFAPFLPFVTEEVWSWWQNGSVHRSSWPQASLLRDPQTAAQPELLTTAAKLIGAVRKAKSDAKVSMRTEVAKATIVASAADMAHVQIVLADVAAAGKLLHTDVAQHDGETEQELSIQLSL